MNAQIQLALIILRTHVCLTDPYNNCFVRSTILIVYFNRSFFSSNPSNHFVDPDCSSSSGGSDYSDSLSFTRRNFDPILEDRIHLPPMDDPKCPKLPSPHLSAPVLPPIRRLTNGENKNRINSGEFFLTSTRFLIKFRGFFVRLWVLYFKFFLLSFLTIRFYN